MNNRYLPLGNYLKNQKGPMYTIYFNQIDSIVYKGLPANAFKRRDFWSNYYCKEKRHTMNWIDAGWKVDSVDMKRQIVRFRKI